MAASTVYMMRLRAIQAWIWAPSQREIYSGIDGTSFCFRIILPELHGTCVIVGLAWNDRLLLAATSVCSWNPQEFWQLLGYWLCPAIRA